MIILPAHPESFKHSFSQALTGFAGSESPGSIERLATESWNFVWDLFVWRGDAFFFDNVHAWTLSLEQVKWSLKNSLVLLGLSPGSIKRLSTMYGTCLFWGWMQSFFTMCNPWTLTLEQVKLSLHILKNSLSNTLIERHNSWGECYISRQSIRQTKRTKRNNELPDRKHQMSIIRNTVFKKPNDHCDSNNVHPYSIQFILSLVRCISHMYICTNWPFDQQTNKKTNVYKQKHKRTNKETTRQRTQYRYLLFTVSKNRLIIPERNNVSDNATMYPKTQQCVRKTQQCIWECNNVSEKAIMYSSSQQCIRERNNVSKNATMYQRTQQSNWERNNVSKNANHVTENANNASESTTKYLRMQQCIWECNNVSESATMYPRTQQCIRERKQCIRERKQCIQEWNNVSEHATMYLGTQTMYPRMQQCVWEHNNVSELAAIYLRMQECNRAQQCILEVTVTMFIHLPSMSLLYCPYSPTKVRQLRSKRVYLCSKYADS